MTESTCEKAAPLWLEPQPSAECHVEEPKELGEVVEGLVSWRLAAPLVWTGCDWFVIRGPFDWAKSPSDLNLSLPPYLCCSFFLRCILTLAQQLGKGAQVEADTEQKGWRSLPLKLCKDWQGRASSSCFSLSVLPLELQRFTKPQIHIHTNTPTHHSPNRDTQPNPLSASLFSSLSLSHTHSRTHTHTRTLSPHPFHLPVICGWEKPLDLQILITKDNER